VVAPVGTVYRVTNWVDHFESSETKKRKRIHRVLIPNKLDGDGYVWLVSHERGPGHFAVWVTIVQVASRCRPRGTLVMDIGRPHTAATLAVKTRLPEDLIAEGIERVLDLGWLETVDESAGPPVERGTPSTAKDAVQDDGTGIGQEEDGKRRPDTRRIFQREQTDPDERAWSFGRSAEWDKCVQLADQLALDVKARRKLARSRFDDITLYSLLRDSSDMRPPLKNASAYVTKSLVGMETDGKA